MDDSKRVGYVISAETVKQLKELAAVDNPIYAKRSDTWWVEYAIFEIHQRIVGKAVKA